MHSMQLNGEKHRIDIVSLTTRQDKHFSKYDALHLDIAERLEDHRKGVMLAREHESSKADQEAFDKLRYQLEHDAPNISMFNTVTDKLEAFQISLSEKVRRLDTSFQTSQTDQGAENRAVKQNLILNNESLQKHEKWLETQ